MPEFILSYAGMLKTNRQEVEDMPLDTAISRIRPALSAILGFALIPFVINFAVLLYMPQGLASSQQAFILSALVAASHAWLLSSVFQLAVRQNFLPQEPHVSISTRALVSLPKVFFSWILVSQFFAAGIGIGPMSFVIMILGFLLVWAPFFCIGEIYVHENKDEQESLSDLPDLDEDELEEWIVKRNAQIFKAKLIWDLGFLRSFRFTTENLGLTGYYFLFYFLSLTIPIALIGNIFGIYGEPLGLLLYSFMDSALRAIVFFLLSQTFLLTLPDTARKEIGVVAPITSDDTAEGASQIPAKTKLSLRLQGRQIPTLVLFLCSLITGYWAGAYQISRFAPPATVEIKASAPRINGDVFEMELRLSDSFTPFDWLMPERFIVEHISAQAQTTPTPVDTSNANAGLRAQAPIPPSMSVYQPDTYQVTTSTGELLSMEDRGAWPKEVLLRLLFKDKDLITGKGKFILFYGLPTGNPIAVFERKKEEVK